MRKLKYNFTSILLYIYWYNTTITCKFIVSSKIKSILDVFLTVKETSRCYLNYKLTFIAILKTYYDITYETIHVQFLLSYLDNCLHLEQLKCGYMVSETPCDRNKQIISDIFNIHTSIAVLDTLGIHMYILVGR